MMPALVLGLQLLLFQGFKSAVQKTQRCIGCQKLWAIPSCFKNTGDSVFVVRLLRTLSPARQEAW